MAMNNSFAEVRPELVPEWSEKNLPLKPDEITFGSNKKVWWRGACGHEWQTSVKARSNGEKCPICSGARVIAGINDLATLEPLLEKQWSEKNKIKPTEVSIGSHKKVIWRCEKGHEWEAAVKSRTINKTGCPYCSHNKVLAGFNDLATLLPDIAAEWSDRNYPLLPTQVTVFANPSVGLILCRDENRTIAEYALRDMSKPIGVSEYHLCTDLPLDLKNALPAVEDIRSRIDMKK